MALRVAAAVGVALWLVTACASAPQASLEREAQALAAQLRKGTDPPCPADAPEGLRAGCYATGQLEYVGEAGQANSRWFTWYESGGLSQAMGFDDTGRLHGPYASWYEDGSPRATGAYEHGKPVGAWRRWARETPD
jgi:hypothetical protein